MKSLVLAIAVCLGSVAPLGAQAAAPSNPTLTVQWGLPGDLPVTGDFDGDGIADLAIFRPSTATWFLVFSVDGFNRAGAARYQWGLPGDVPMPGDYNGDHVTDLAVYRPSTGTWYIKFTEGRRLPYRPFPTS